MKINFLNASNSFNTTFNATVKNPVKNSSGINCAMCNRKMISQAERLDFYSKITLPASDFVNTDEFNKMNADMQKVAKEIAEKYPNSSIITLYDEKKVYDITKKLSLADKASLYNAAFKELLPADKLAPNLIKLKKQFPDMPKYGADFIDLAVKYSKLYPSESLTEIFSKPEIVEIHKKAATESTMKTKKKLYKTLENIEKISKKLPPSTKKELEELNKLFPQKIKTYFGMRPLYPTEPFLLSYYAICDNIQDKNLAEKLKKEIEKFPVGTYLDVHHYIMSLQTGAIEDKKLSQAIKNKLTSPNAVELDIFEEKEKIKMEELSDSKIIYDIISRFFSTFEHIVPAKFSGSNNPENGLFFCTYCNNARGTLSYEVLLNLFPNFAKNVNAQIQQIISLIKEGSLPAYLEKDVPVKIKETLLNVTNDKLSVNIKDYLDFRKEKVVEKLTNTKNQLQKIEKNVFSDEELELKQNRLERITEIINALKKERAILNNVIHMHNINKKKQKQLSQTLKEILDEQKHVNELIDNDEKLN